MEGLRRQLDAAEAENKQLRAALGESNASCAALSREIRLQQLAAKALGMVYLMRIHSMRTAFERPVQG